jgi:hypothetical protein
LTIVRQPPPVRIASGMPSKYPSMLDSGVLKSPCASNQMTPGDRSGRPVITPRPAKQLPESRTGKAPSSIALLTAAETSPISSKAALASLAPLRSLRSSLSSIISRLTFAPWLARACSAPASSSRSGPRPTPILNAPTS